MAVLDSRMGFSPDLRFHLGLRAEYWWVYWDLARQKFRRRGI